MVFFVFQSLGHGQYRVLGGKEDFMWSEAVGLYHEIAALGLGFHPERGSRKFYLHSCARENHAR